MADRSLSLSGQDRFKATIANSIAQSLANGEPSEKPFPDQDSFEKSLANVERLTNAFLGNHMKCFCRFYSDVSRWSHFKVTPHRPHRSLITVCSH
jgi:hypothetical protein